MGKRRLRVLFAWLVLSGAVALVLPAGAERQPYSRYQSIVDRQMFGPLPPNFDPTKSPAEVSKGAGTAAEKELSKEQEKVKSSVRFSVINITPEGETAIGFTDNSNPKAPKHYYLKVGESRDGWEVKAADAKAATMTIAKDGVEVSLSLGGDSAKDGKTQAATAASAASAVTPRRSPVLGTLGSRRRARQEREEADAREAARREADAKALEEERTRREEERARREEEEKAQRAAEREEQRRQLEQIREELRKSREERQGQGAKGDEE